MDVPSHDEVVEQIDSFLSRHDMAPTTFGREALGEASFVKTVREGRMPGLQTLLRLSDFMRERDGRLMATEGKTDRQPGHRLSAGAR